MTRGGPIAYRALMHTSDAPRRPPAGWPRLPAAWPWLGGWPLDVAIAAAVGMMQLVGTSFAAQNQPASEPMDVLGYALLAAGPVATLARRRRPVAVFAVAFAVTLLYSCLGYPQGPIYFAMIVAFFTVVLAGHRVVAWLCLAVGYVSFLWLVPLVRGDPPPDLVHAAGLGAWLLVLGTVAEIVRVRRAYLRATEQRAVEAERTREEEARRRASEERLRIARELHDVLAHNISLINVQAGVALHLIDERPEQARTALVAIKQASKDALGEVRATLGALRQVDEQPPRSPTPSLTRLDDLAARVAVAGLEVRTRVAGAPRPLPAGVDLAAFRIVQEALTNVARHAGPATATVQVTYGQHDLTVQVDDDGRGVPEDAAPGGSGILGMRERAAALGGQLEAGPRPGRGFRVLARLPLDGTT